MKILVGMSGGVDSSVAAYLLKKQGYDVIGATMSIWDKNRHFSGLTIGDGCFSPHEEQDVAAAKSVCEQLGIPHHTVDCTAVYKKTVLENFKTEYLSGRTPNPCVWCNAKIKFDALPRAAKESGLDFDKFATGHYARILFNDSLKHFELLKGIDPKKDQSYFLYRLSQQQLSNILLPLGDKTKTEIREIAQAAGLPVFDKPDSQDFYTGDVNDIIQAAPKIGNFVTRSGKILGHHNGIWNYTVGQRKGLGISAERPMYVLELRPETNEVVLGFNEENRCKALTAKQACWSAAAAPTETFAAQAKIRSSQTPVSVTVTPAGEDGFRVDFETEQRGIAAGQSVVLYDGDTVSGGGIISGIE